MAKFNPDFWEVTISAESWRRFSTEHHLYYESPEEARERHARLVRAEAMLPQLRALMNELLTSRQREVVTLYFLARLNQRQIADKLGITQQVVCEHLYGKMRNGHLVGGALRKLRKACAERGIGWAT
ncbi:MAG: sigma factor-like helix-turn-helix DNA-binding protein [Candidatus Eisenbacteria bacterium]